MEQAYYYDKDKFSTLLYSIIVQHSTEKTCNWLQEQKEKLDTAARIQRFNLTFTAIPRFAGKDIVPSAVPAVELLPGEPFFIQGYTLDRLVRMWWLLQLPADDKVTYVQTMEGLFDAADMNEQTALYGALPLLAWPEAWKLRTAEGIRSNIGPVQDAVMLNNIYPARYLDEPAWNQLVMKAFFTDKQIGLIIGLDQRANPLLAAILRDYAHERWAAGRTVNPMLWRLVGPFINADTFPDIERLWHSGVSAEQAAAALACAASTYTPAQILLNQSAGLKEKIAGHDLTWDTIAQHIA
jgi:hypothetical protein